MDVEIWDGRTVVSGVSGSGKISLVRPRNRGSVHCCASSIVRDPEPCD